MILYKSLISFSVLLIGTIFFSYILNRGVPQGAPLVCVHFCRTLIYSRGCYYFPFVDDAQDSSLMLHRGPSSLIVFGCEGELPAILPTRGQQHWFGCSSCLPHVSHLQWCILSKRSETSSWGEEECSSVDANGLTALLEPPASSRTFPHVPHLKQNPSLWKYLPTAVYHLCWWCPPCCHLGL